jgi:HEAT repeat protein
MTAMMHLLNHRVARCGLLLLLVCAIALSFIRPQSARADDPDIRKLNRFMQTSKTDTPAAKMFREGRDLIEAGNYREAAQKFSDFVNNYPKDRDVDAALYWLAYALNKQGNKDDARKVAARLLQDFPRSAWRQDASALLIQLGDQATVEQAIRKDDCEIKVIALQSLFDADEDRAVNFVADVLKSNSQECPGLKSAAVQLLGSHGGPRAVPLLLEIARNQSLDLKLRQTAIRHLGDENSEAMVDELTRLYDTDRTPEIRAQLLRAFAEMHSPRAEAKLIDLARNGDSLELRATAIRYLGERDGSASLDELIRLFDADHTPAIRAQILRALAESNDPRAHAKLLDVARHGETPELRVEAIRQLGENSRGTLTDDLLQLYSTETSEEIKMGLLRAYAEMNDPRASAKLYEVARSMENLNLRLYAIKELGERNDEQTTQELSNLYDGESNVQVKATLIRAFGESRQKAAVRKLIQIARSDPSIELRKLAIRFLGESKDPEALKFLEDLLK